MEARFHRRVQSDLNEILAKYYNVSERLGDDFFAEFRIALGRICGNPRFFHFDSSGLRRCNLERFPIMFFTISDSVLIAHCSLLTRLPDMVLRRQGTSEYTYKIGILRPKTFSAFHRHTAG